MLGGGWGQRAESPGVRPSQPDMASEGVILQTQEPARVLGREWQPSPRTKGSCSSSREELGAKGPQGLSCERV